MAQFTQIGRYKIEAELGRGAMGTVFRARDPLMDRVVAIKTILSNALSGPLAEEYRERFLREARAVGRLSHPGIVTVFDVGEHETTPFLVMEYVPGRTLASALDAGERFTFERVYELGQQLAEALGFAHASGVIHRDIKPANILLTVPPGHTIERAKIADFGVAKLTATQMTATGQLLGTPSFMPPEQFTGAVVDGRSDLFSLGVILYSLATGDKPFPGDTLTAVSYKVVHTNPLPPRVINPAVPPDLERVILKCLEKDPGRRYASGEELARDLSNLRAGLAPVHAAATPGRAADPDATMDIHITPQERAAMLSPAASTHARATTKLEPPPQLAPSPATPFSHKLLYVSAGLIALMVITYGVVQLGQANRSPDRVIGPVQRAPADAGNAGANPQSEVAKKAAPPPAKRADSQTKPGPGAEPAAPPKAPQVPVDLVNLEPFILKQIEDARRLAEAAGRTGALGTPNDRRVFMNRIGDSTPRPIPPGHARLRVDATQIPMNIGFTVVSGRNRVFRARSGQGLMHPVYENVFLIAGDHQIQIAFHSGDVPFAQSGKLPGSFEPDKNYTLVLALKGRSLEASLASGGESAAPASAPHVPSASREQTALAIDTSTLPEMAFLIEADRQVVFQGTTAATRAPGFRIEVPVGAHQLRAFAGTSRGRSLGSRVIDVEIQPRDARVLKVEMETRELVIGNGGKQRIPTGRLKLTLE